MTNEDRAELERLRKLEAEEVPVRTSDVWASRARNQSNC